jgi:hypothetical protein
MLLNKENTGDFQPMRVFGDSFQDGQGKGPDQGVPKLWVSSVGNAFRGLPFQFPRVWITCSRPKAAGCRCNRLLSNQPARNSDDLLGGSNVAVSVQRNKVTASEAKPGCESLRGERVGARGETRTRKPCGGGF